MKKIIIEFFIPLKKIPTVTAQQKRASIKSNKIIFYDDEKIKKARALFIAHLGQHAPKEKLNAPIRLITKWCYPKGSHLDGAYKTTKPDTDNLIKIFKDCMTVVGFWKDDAHVASEITEKFWSNISGIYVKVEEI